MIHFITDIQHEREPDILAHKPTERLLIISLEHQLLASYNAPKDGWTHEILIRLSRYFCSQWNFCGCDAIIGELWVGSTEV